MDAQVSQLVLSIMDLHPDIQSTAYCKEAQPVDSQGHYTLFSFAHGLPRMVQESYLPLSHQGIRFLSSQCTILEYDLFFGSTDTCVG